VILFIALTVLIIALTVLIGQRNELKAWGHSNVINQLLKLGRPSYAAVLRLNYVRFRFNARVCPTLWSI